MITGKNLIDLGYKPAPWFKTALFYLNTLNSYTDESVKEYCDYLVKTTTVETIEPYTTPKPYKIFLDATNKDEEDNLNQVIATMEEVMKTPYAISGYIMPDACPAGSIGTIPVGGVVVMDGVIVPGMHSADICCSLMLTEFKTNADMSDIMDTAFNTTHFGYGKNGNIDSTNSLPNFEKLFDKIKNNKITNKYLSLAEAGLGTQGDGNHFLFLGTSKKSGNKCLVTHHGSRGFGAKVFKEGQQIAEEHTKKYSPKTNLKNAFIPFETDKGRQYWEALQIVKQWTELNHRIIHKMIIDKFGGDSIIVNRFWNEHNFVFKQDSFFYHAKGATPVNNNFDVGYNNTNLKIIPLNMSEPILIVEPTISLFAPHGAGRNFGRSEFVRRGNTKESLNEEINGLDVRFYSGVPDVSEYPSAYKNAETVKSQIEKYNLCKVVDEILPYGSIMAGEQQPFWKR